MVTRLLVTGAAGSIGTDLRPRLARPGRVLRLMDLVPVPDPGPGEEVVTGSVTDRDAVAAAVAGVDAVVHLAGIPDEAPWGDIVAANVDGTQAVLDAAARAGVGHVVLASSNHAAGFHTRDAAGPLPATAEPRPDTFYGWSKAALEALGRLYHDRCGTHVVCLRIGSWAQRPGDARALSTWISPDDGGRLVEAALAARGFHTVWGVSANTRRWWSLDEGAALGYHPLDDAEAHAAGLLGDADGPDLTGPVHHRVGGAFTVAPLGERLDS
ncbi:NAD-dependent epimerase/dehydratase family protein [Pseudonocardia broussonetiae]|uniref:NAD-dependent epimerase/dehydratase family protein n=1 Tax=Pseudonocardia broussonetiae TaxID=2736640 RepID=UPI001F0408B0|nr:NAD(P)-dependent oxidoreductase [Pseudonocardia broussonetiae]